MLRTHLFFKKDYIWGENLKKDFHDCGYYDRGLIFYLAIYYFIDDYASSVLTKIDVNYVYQHLCITNNAIVTEVHCCSL